MNTEYIIFEEVSVVDFTIIGCPLVHLGMVVHRGSAKMDLIKLIPDDAVISARKKNQIKFQFNLDHGITKIVTWTLLPIND